MPCWRPRSRGGAICREGPGLCENSNSCNRDRTSYSFEIVFGAYIASPFEIELKNIILVALRVFEFSHSLALQLHLSSEVSAASVGLVSSPPERPCENTVDRDAPLSELDSDATDFLDRPADQERCLVLGRRVFLSAGSTLAR